MKSNKMYLVDEVTLLHLLSDQLELRQLEASGVDNWSWYGEGRKEFILEAIEDRVPQDELPDELDFDYVAKLDLKKFHVCKASSIDGCRVYMYEDDLK